MARTNGAIDRAPRTRDAPNGPNRHLAGTEGRTVAIRINGYLSEASYAVLMAAPGQKKPQKLETCLVALARYTALADTV